MSQRPGAGTYTGILPKTAGGTVWLAQSGPHERTDGSWLVLDPGTVAAVAWQPDNGDDDTPGGPYV